MKPTIIGDATVYQGDCRPGMRLLADSSADACIADPPYGDTSLKWDSKVDGWVAEIARVLRPNASVWVFGSMRFLAPLFAEFATVGFKYSQDIVWKKQNGTGFHVDRFRRVHEHAVLFYRGAWANVYHDTQFTMDASAKTVRRKTRPTHTGHIATGHYVSEDGGPKMMVSVMEMRNEHGKAVHPTQMPVDLILPLLCYSVPPGGIVIDPFMGSASVGVAARIEGRKYIGFEKEATIFQQAQQRLTEQLSDGPLFASQPAKQVQEALL